MKTTESPEQLLKAELNAFIKLGKLQIDLRAAEETAAGLLADEGGELGEAARVAMSLKGEIDLIERAVQGLRQRRIRAIGATLENKAADLREQATKLRNEGDQIAAACQKHLSKLSELQGIPYDTSILFAQRAGSWLLAGVAHGKIPLIYANQFEVLADDQSAVLVSPKTRQLYDQAYQLDGQAGHLILRADASPQRDGQATGTDLDSLVAAACADPLRIQPDLSAIAEWVATIDAKVFPDEVDANMERRYMIIWRDETIDIQLSNLMMGRHTYTAAIKGDKEWIDLPLVV